MKSIRKMIDRVYDFEQVAVEVDGVEFKIMELPGYENEGFVVYNGISSYSNGRYVWEDFIKILLALNRRKVRSLPGNN